MCTCAGECCFPRWGNNFIFQLLSKRILKRDAKAFCKRKRFHNCQPSEIMENICIPNIPVNKHCLTHFIWLSQFLITITFAENKGHCDYQQQTMPVNIFPSPQNHPPNVFHYLHMTLLLLLYFWVEHGFILCGVKGKTKALFNLMMTIYFLILSLELRSSKPVCQNPSEEGEEGGLKHTWCWIHQCGSFLIVNYVVHLCRCVYVCVSAWKSLILFTQEIIISKHLEGKAFLQSGGGNSKCGSRGKAVLVYSKACL